MPTAAQLEVLYRISYQLTYIMLQPIHLVCIDDRTLNVYILAGYNEEIEFQILPNGEARLMSKVNYNAMSNAQLKDYFLKHPGDRASLQIYLDRINQKPLKIIASPDDPNFEQKVQDAIRQKLAESKNFNMAINQQ